MNTGELEAIVLAAGAGTRFGGGKLLAPFGGSTVVAAALEGAFAPPVRRVILVTGSDGEAVGAEACRAAGALGRADHMTTVRIGDWADGMSASLKAGIQGLQPDVDGAFVFLGDMPRTPRALPARLAEAFSAGAHAVAPLWRGERGHPVLFGRAMFPDLLALSGDAGARTLLDALGSKLATVEAEDDGVLFDVDTPADLAPADLAQSDLAQSDLAQSALARG